MTEQLWDRVSLVKHNIGISELEFLAISDDCVEFVEIYSLLTPDGRVFEGLQVFRGWLEYLAAPVLPMGATQYNCLLSQMKASLLKPLSDGYRWKSIIEEDT